MDTATILYTLATATIPAYVTMTPVNQGISDAQRTTLPAPDGTPIPVLVKREAWANGAVAEVLAYAVATATPGLVDCPPVVARRDAEGEIVSVHLWYANASRPDRHGLRDCLRSDVVGLVAFDHIIGNRDRAPWGHNYLTIPTGHHHHDRIVAIDNSMGFGDAFGASPDMATVLSGQRIPHYLHDHMGRIIGAHGTLSRTYDALDSAGLVNPFGRVPSVAGIVANASRFANLDTFPDPR